MFVTAYNNNNILSTITCNSISESKKTARIMLNTYVNIDTVTISKTNQSVSPILIMFRANDKAITTLRYDNETKTFQFSR